MIHLVVAVVALFEPAVGGPAVSPSADDVLRMLRRFEPCRIESSMVLEASFQGRVERSRPLEAIYVVAPAVDDGEARALLRMNGYRTIVDGAGLSITHEEAEDVFVRLPSGDSPLAAHERVELVRRHGLWSCVYDSGGEWARSGWVAE